MSEVDWIEKAFRDRARTESAILAWVDDERITWGFRKEKLDPEAADDEPLLMFFAEELGRVGPGLIGARVQVDIVVPQEPPVGGLEVLGAIDQALLDSFYETVWRADGHKFDCWETDATTTRPVRTEPLRRTRNLMVHVTEGAG